MSEKFLRDMYCDYFLNKSLCNILDVRSEKEFLEGHLPGAINSPILIDEHRHQVGICYKQKGQDEAIKLGHQLVDPYKEQYIKQWKSLLKNNLKYVHCWRGGLRSNITATWLKEVGINTTIVEGGYKAVRNLLLTSLQKNYNFLSLSGLTGTGKTKLLQELDEEFVLDLEGAANHRGSSFGAYLDVEQSTQQTFENTVALKLFIDSKLYIVEHESRFIGRCVVNNNILQQINIAPQVIITESMQNRVYQIYSDYVLEAKPGQEEILKQKLLKSLCVIQKGLGGKLYTDIKNMMSEAIEEDNKDKHLRWIEMLLDGYYDKRYYFSMKKNQVQKNIFEGNYHECKEFLCSYINRWRP